MADLFTPHASFDSILQVSEPTTKPALTKVACTLGPCSHDLDTIKQMLEHGMDCARFDFSWGTKEYHTETVETLFRAMRHTKLPCAIMLDTAGTEIHIYNKEEGNIDIVKGDTVTLKCDQIAVPSSNLLPVSIDSFKGMDLVPGTSVFIGQYLFTGSETTSAYLTVSEVVDDNTVTCVANDSASLSGPDFIVNFSGITSPLPILSEQDKFAIRTFGKMYKIHFLCLSLCRSAADVQECRQVLNKYSQMIRSEIYSLVWPRVGLTSTKILAKIENISGLQNFSEILKEADGIIFSRGLIGLEIAPEKMFRVQKYVIDECNSACKPVIVTRVMDTMTDSPRPTRAEATDIANLVLDGVDCLLLGAETFRGKHPVTTIITIKNIAKQAETTFDSEVFNQRVSEAGKLDERVQEEKLESLAGSAVKAASLINADLVIVFTVSGRAARVLSKFRPPVPILSVVFPKLVSNGLKWTFSGEAEARQLCVTRNCVPILADPNLGGAVETEAAVSEGSMLVRAIAYAYNKKWIKLWSRIVVSQHAKKNTNWEFEETGVFKILVVSNEVLDEAIDTYNAHSESVQTLRQKMFAHSRAPSFTGHAVNEMPITIPLRSKGLISTIQEMGDEEGEEGEAGRIYEVSDQPATPVDCPLRDA